MSKVHLGVGTKVRSTPRWTRSQNLPCPIVGIVVKVIGKTRHVKVTEDTLAGYIIQLTEDDIEILEGRST